MGDRFDLICTWLLNIEDAGLTGCVKNLGDGAGLTRFGITSEFDSTAIPSDYFTKPAADALVDAENVYHAHYWSVIRGDEIEPDDVAASLFAFAVNIGTQHAIEVVQSALNLDPDGKVGPITLIGLASPGAGDKIRAAMAAHYRAHDQGQFLNGLLKRAALVYPSLEGFV